MIEMNQFRQNQSRIPLEELQKYNGKYVAWSEDGIHILASDADAEKLAQSLRAAGYDTGEILVSYMDVPEDIEWGGVFLSEGKGPRMIV